MQKKSDIKLSDLQGAISLLTDATVGVTELTEAMHRRIAKPSFLPYTPVQKAVNGISGFVYGRVNRTAKLVGGGIGKAINRFDPELRVGLKMEKKEELQAVLNGVVGDHLVKEQNPLAISMQLRYEGEPITLSEAGIRKAKPKANGKILLILHGLCMNDLQWTWKGHNHGEKLAKELGLTPIYLHYNTGLHISENGEAFSQLMGQLVEAWPEPIEEITILAHSMGGLVTRSAFHYATKQGRVWQKHLKTIIFLGSPHYGAPLERVGNHVDHFLEAIPYAKPFARLGKIRSAGITDLRMALLTHEDWMGMDRFQDSPEGSTHIPLPLGVNCYAVAGCVNGQKDSCKMKTAVLGDGLVRVSSALGRSDQAEKRLHFTKEQTYIAYETNHMALLGSQEVFAQIKRWMLSKHQTI